MPAIIAHEFFGLDLLDEFESRVSLGQEVRNAFLLGNQGPDPLFYLSVNPIMFRLSRLGVRMHKEDPSALILAWIKVVGEATSRERCILQAYASGFVCHYLLDSTIHPFVYSQQYAICDAGIEGLSRKDGPEVHALIESDLDEMILFSRTGLTIADFAPQKEILNAAPETLSIVSAAFAELVDRVYGIEVSQSMFTGAIKHFRVVRGMLHSPSGTKRRVAGGVEKVFRPHSFAKAMMPRPVPNEQCCFANFDHRVWRCPFTSDESTASFADLFEEAQIKAREWLPRLFAADGCSIEDVHEMTGFRNFSGDKLSCVNP